MSDSSEFIPIECPHCQEKGETPVLRSGLVLIGPCPECGELVIITFGTVLALDKSVFQNGSRGEILDHIKGVVQSFISDRFNQLSEEGKFDASEIPGINYTREEHEEDEKWPEIEDVTDQYQDQLPQNSNNHDITQIEVNQFTDVALKLLDDKAYFKSIFG